MDVKASNTIYTNTYEIPISQSHMPGASPLGVMKTSCRCTAVFLGLLCLFLLAGLLTVVFLCKSDLKEELHQLKNCCKDLLDVKDQLQKTPN